jgi:hypothetical protein
LDGNSLFAVQKRPMNGASSGYFGATGRAPGERIRHGRIACKGAEEIDIAGIVREMYASAGYDLEWYPAPEQVDIRADLCLGPLANGEADFRAVADDQSVITGYAIDLALNSLPHAAMKRICYEVKISRADFFCEMRQPIKAPDGITLLQ